MDAVDHPEVEDKEARAARRNTVAGPQTSVELVVVDVHAVYDLPRIKKEVSEKVRRDEPWEEGRTG